MFATIYVCSEHGETWHAERVESFDNEHDEVYVDYVCPKCMRVVTPLEHDGHPVVHVLTDEEIEWELMFPMDEDNEFDY